MVAVLSGDDQPPLWTVQQHSLAKLCGDETWDGESQMNGKDGTERG